jgi:hypothetical protein
MPQITHRDLVAFADEKVNLKKSEVDDQRAQVNRLRDRIEAKIDAAPEYGLVKSLHAGSVAKGTALRNVNDRDLAVYVKAGQAPDDTPSLVQWLRDQIGEAYSMLSADQIVANTNCVTVTFAGSGLSVDVVPVLYEGEPNDVGCLVSKDTGEKLKTSVRQHLDFIRGRKKAHPKDLAQLITRRFRSSIRLTSITMWPSATRHGTGTCSSQRHRRRSTQSPLPTTSLPMDRQLSCGRTC